MDHLSSIFDGDFSVISQSLDNRHWIVLYLLDDGPSGYYHYDRVRREGKFLFPIEEDLEELPLAPMHPVVIESRDGLELVSYLTLPTWTDPDGDGRPGDPMPMVLLVHGGPWARDEWGPNPQHQWLANRGYAVLSVNFRGSMGFGKEFLNAGNKEWAAKMHDDLIDAVNWAIEEGVADPDRIAIMGSSYGGYATLVGLTFTPDVFACGVAFAGPSNLITQLESIPPHWASAVDMFRTRVGDHRTEEGRAFLRDRSPINHVDRIKRPLLIGQGSSDPRVKQAESDQIVHAMQARDLPVIYLLYPDEGHSFASVNNQRSFHAVAEAFLASCLGGRFQPIRDSFRNSSITVPVGAEQIAGLEKLPSPAMPMATYRDDPQEAADYNLRGLAYYQHGEYQEAILDLNEAIRLDPQYAEAYNNRGAAYGDLGHHRRAIQDYDEAIRLDPRLALAYNNRGVAYIKLNQHQRAIEDLNQAILLDPEDAQAYANRAISYTFLRKDTAAQHDTERSVALGFDRAFIESAIEEAKWQR